MPDIYVNSTILYLQTHSSFEKACKIALVKFRNIQYDEKHSMRGSSLKKAVEEDKAKGLVPFYVSTGIDYITTSYICVSSSVH